MENVARTGTVEQRADERQRRFSDVVIWRKGDNDFGAVDEATTVRLVQMRFAMKQGRIGGAGSRTRARRREPRISHPLRGKPALRLADGLLATAL